jgi:hypothetical protein
MGLSLRQARLCLDCDCLTDELFCPWCDRDGTVPIAGWFRPMDDGKGDASRQRKPPPQVARQWVLVVQHQQGELYRILRQALAGTGVEVLYERRVGQRRRKVTGPAVEEQRRAERRRPRPSAVVYQESPTVDESESSLRPNTERQTVRVPRPRRRQPAPV